MSQQEMNWNQLLNRVKQIQGQQQQMIYEIVALAAEFEQEVSTFEL